MTSADDKRLLEGLALLATTSRDHLHEVEEIGELLAVLDNAQKVVMEQLGDSIPDFDASRSKVADADDEIAALDSQILQVQEELLAVLSSSSTSQKNPDDVLRALILNFQSVFMVLVKEFAENGESSVPIQGILPIEHQIAKTIDELFERGLYPESDSETKARLQRRELHTKKLNDSG
jgi:hypothetical protein